MLKSINKYGLWGLWAIAFGLILYKAITIPITHDETATTVHYAKYSTWEMMMYPDNWPNNHILNTYLSKRFMVNLGKHPWAVRLPNVLSFLLLVWGANRLIRVHLPKESWLVLPAGLLFIANPYLLDFFGLCRGYGMAAGFATLSISFLISGYLQTKKRHIWTAVVLAMLAAYANFTLLVFWGATLLLAAFYFIQAAQYKFKDYINPNISLVLLSLAFLALIIIPIHKMQSTNQFEYWTSKGFYKETILSLVSCWQYSSTLFGKWSRHPLAVGAILIVLFNLAYGIWRQRQYRVPLNQQPAFLAALILTTTALVSILQSMLLQTPNLSGRTALFFYPLFSATLVGTLGIVAQTQNTRYIRTTAVVLGLIAIFHLADRYNPKATKEWWYDENTYQVLHYIEQQYDDQPIRLKTNWLFHPSFHFYAATGKTPFLDLQPYDKNIDATTDATYYYILASDYEQLEAQFQPVLQFEDCWLLERR